LVSGEEVSGVLVSGGEVQQGGRVVLVSGEGRWCVGWWCVGQQGGQWHIDWQQGGQQSIAQWRVGGVLVSGVEVGGEEVGQWCAEEVGGVCKEVGGALVSGEEVGQWLVSGKEVGGVLVGGMLAAHWSAVRRLAARRSAEVGGKEVHSMQVSKEVGWW
jgi:hypothetical protein